MRIVLVSTAAFGGGVLVGIYIGFWLMTRPEYVSPGTRLRRAGYSTDEP